MTTTPRLRLPVTQQQFEKIEDAWFLASFGGSPKRISGYDLTWFEWAVEHVTGVNVHGQEFELEVANG